MGAHARHASLEAVWQSWQLNAKVTGVSVVFVCGSVLMSACFTLLLQYICRVVQQVLNAFWVGLRAGGVQMVWGEF